MASAPLLAALAAPRCVFHEDLTAAEQDSARAAARSAHAPTQIRQVCVRVHHVTLDGLTCALIVATVVQGHPLTTELLRTLDILPAQGRLN